MALMDSLRILKVPFLVIFHSPFRLGHIEKNIENLQNQSNNISNDPIKHMIQIHNNISSKPLSSDDVDKLDETLKVVFQLTSSSNVCNEKPKTPTETPSLKPFDLMTLIC